MKRSTLVGVVAAVLLALPVPALGQAQAAPALTLTTPYPGVVTQPGEDVSYAVRVRGPIGDRVVFDVKGLPADWQWTIKGGGSLITSATIEDELGTSVTVTITVPPTAHDGAQRVELSAQDGTGTATLPLDITVNEAAGGASALTTEYPALEGPIDATFTFRLGLSNQSPTERTFQLASEAPSGWRVDVRPSGQDQASVVTVDAGGTARLNVEVHPAVTADAGEYPVRVTAAAGDIALQSDLAVQLVGSEKIRVDTITQALNADVTAGEPSDIDLLVVNAGSTTVGRVQLAATTPNGWEVAFEPATVVQLPPGKTQTVSATVTPSADAVAGDYRLGIRATTDQAQDSIELRTTVNPSPVWGLVGIGVIALALVFLAWMFRRFGRR